MKLIVGLGNPGKEYIHTRHNIGFDLLDYISSQKNYQINKKKFNSYYEEIIVQGEKVILLKPLTYMNLSGDAVVQFVNYYHIYPQDILIIQDDLDMILGKVKIVNNSSSGGHNGIKSIEQSLKTKEYFRLKIGIQKDENIDVRDYVLSSFSKEEQNIIQKTYDKLINIVEDFCLMSSVDLKNKYNNK